MNYKMFSDDALKHFGKFCDSANFTRPRNPSGAFDAKPRYARDAAPQATPEKDNLIRSLLGVIDDMRPKGGAADQEPDDEVVENLVALKDHLAGVLAGDDRAKADYIIDNVLLSLSARKEGAEDQPPEFPGKPQRPAMDASATAGFHRMFPGAARIGQDSRFGEPPAQRSRPPSSASIDSFNRMFPQAAKIGNLG